MDNPEKLATQGAQDEEKQNKHTICVGHHYTQTNTNNVNKTRDLLQLEVKTNIIFQFIYKTYIKKKSQVKKFSAPATKKKQTRKIF